MEGIEPRANAHGMVPSQWKCPPYERTEDRLADGQGNDVAFAREKPAEDRAPDKSEGNENGIWPMQQAEKGSGDEGSGKRFLQGREETIHKKRLQPDFLKQTKCEIARESARFDKMFGKTVSPAEKQSHDGNSQDENAERHRRAASCRP